ncbi:BppU family phage baseplate upper protein [Enterococcus durans]|uniref:BppU family phage baseplate upper protein n=1 Tax=Enterococcus durans TaxID=53345 RepID=UPI0013CA3F02|nr:BppU family phage baseplate upper protein [Enterococcus durans]NEX85767.1 BppU family phage baseplate upper protein [Enterococcus durans]
MVYKTNESIIVIQAEAISPNRTDVVFWSHDRGTAKLRMKLVRKNGIPQSLPEGTTVPIRLIFKSATAEGGYGKHDYLATVEDPVNGIVSIVLEDNILGYVGTVEGSVYIDFPNDRSLDTAGRFTFSIKRSPIDDSTPELEDYYFNGFSQTIDKIEQIVSNAKTEIGEKVAESETQIEAKLKDTNDKITKANQDVATLNTNIDKANDRIDQTNQQIGDLGQLKRMYSNSIDFGGKGSSLSDFLDAPYYLSKVPLQENIANRAVQFPISSSNYTLYSADMQEPYIAGETYTVTISATKPSAQTFRVYSEGTTDYYFGDLKPVEGLVDVWSLTFTTTKVSSKYPKLLQILQYPAATVGACKIDWLKIEKGDTRTPNISEYKYFGEGLKDSNNPNDYSWDVTPEYTEKRLNDSVSLTEPQSIDGTKNFLETPMVNGEKLLTDTAIPFEAWYVQAAEIRPASNGSKLPVGRELTTIGKKNRRSMKSNPLNWSSDQLSAEVVRDCTLLIDGTVVLEFGGTSGSWAYVEIRNGIDIIGEGYGAGISQQYKLWYRNGIPFSRYITLKAGTQLSIGVSMLEGTSLTKAVISRFHVMEIDE